MISCVGPATQKLQYVRIEQEQLSQTNEQNRQFGDFSSHAGTGLCARQVRRKPPKRLFSATFSGGRKAPRVSLRMKRGIYDRRRPVSTRRFSAANCGRERILAQGRIADTAAKRIGQHSRLRPLLYTKFSAVSAVAGPYFSGDIVKLARPWLTLRTAAE